MDELVSSLNTLSIETKDVAQLSDTLLKLSASTEKSELAKIVYQKAVDDWHLSRSVALLAKNISEDPKDGHTFRTAFLRHLQNDYKSKLYESKVLHHPFKLNCVAFISLSVQSDLLPFLLKLY